MRFLKSEAGAIVLWLISALFAAALLYPWLYLAGKSLAANASVSQYPSAVHWLADACAHAKPDRYFSRALLISALALLPLLIRRVKSISAGQLEHPFALRKSKWSQRLFHLFVGLLLGATTLGVLGLVLKLTGTAFAKNYNLSTSSIFAKAFLPALGAGLIEELMFRGLLLGLWLRACSMWTAWIGSSMIFSFVHFLKPARGFQIPDPCAWHSGFEMLASTLGNFTNPVFFITEFATLAILGLILAYCRTRTFSLWLPIGIHVGLVFALKFFSMTHHLNKNSPLAPWWIGGDLKTGMLPLLTLCLCLAASILFVRKFSPAEQ